MTKIILATKSPYRQKAFSFLNLDFIAEESNIDEQIKDRPDDPEELVKILSRLKTEAVSKNHSEGIVIGFDSAGHFNGLIMEKPKSRTEAFRRLQSLSGNTHKLLTGIYMLNIKTGQSLSKVSKTEIFMRQFTDSEINKYLDQHSEFNAGALGYDPTEHYSSSFVKKIVGDYNNLIRGVPLAMIVEMLIDIGFKA